MAESEDGKVSNKVNPLVRQLEEHLAAAHDALREIKRLLAGENPVADAMVYWGQLWTRAYGGPYAWARAKDAGNIKRLVNTIGLEELKARMIVYFSSEEPFFVKNRHPFGVFIAQVNSFAGAPRLTAARATNCKHDPPCESDAQHTRRYLEDTRR